MARFLVEILINAAGGPQARAAFDDVGAGASSASKKLESLVTSGLQAERALRRTAESADRLQHQMEETKASKGLTADLVSLNKRLHEQIAATREGAIGLERYEQKQRESALAARILQTQVKAGVSAQSAAGREIAEQIRLHDRLQSELRQTASLQSRTGGGVFSREFSVGSIVGVIAAYQTLSTVIRRVSREVVDSEGAMAQLRAGVESTGGSAGFSAIQLSEMADALSRLTGIDDEVIAGGEAILLTFRQIREGAFFDAMTDAMDLAARKGMDLESAINLVGKTYSGSLDAARRAGVMFTESQKEQIKTLLDAGKTLEAQVLIHQEFQQAVGGSAKAARDTLGGAITALNSRWGDLLEAVGKSGDGPFRTGIEAMIKLLEGLTDNVNVFGATWFEVLADINTGIALYARGWARTIETTKYLGNAGAANVADQIRQQAERLEKEAERLRNRAERELSADAGLSGIFGTIPDDINPVTEAIGDLGSSLDNLADKQRSAAESVRDLINDLGLEAEQHENLASAARESTDAHDAATLSIKQNNAVLKAREGLLKVGLDLTKDQEAAIRSYVARIDTATKAEQLWLAVRKSVVAVSISPRDNKVLADRAELSLRAVNTEKNLRDAYVLSADALSKETTAILRGLSARDAYLQSLDIEQRIREALGERTKENSELYDALAAELRIKIIAQIEAEVDSTFAESLKQSLVTPRQELQSYLDLVKRLSTAAADGTPALLSAAQAEELRTRATLQFIDQSLSAWGGFFSYLGSAFGGLFQQISQMISSIQSGYQAGSQLGGMTSMGAAAGGAAGIFVAVVAEVYKWMKSEAAKRKSEGYGYAAIISKDSGDWSSPQMGEARRASMQIKETIEALASAIGGVFDTFADLEIQVRRDGKYFKSYVEGVLVGSFSDMQSAVEAAILKGLRSPETFLSGVSDLVREGLTWALSDGVVKVGSLDELQDFLTSLREISDIALGPAVAGMLEQVRAFESLRDQLRELKSDTEAVTDGFNNLNLAEARTWQALFDSITGRQRTQAEIRAEKEAELEIARAELEIRKASIQQRILQAQAEIAALRAGNALIGGGGGSPGINQGGGGGGIVGLTYAFAMSGQALAATTALVAGTVSAATQAMMDALEAEVRGLQDLLAALGNLKIPDIDFGALGRGGGGGAGAGTKDNVRQFIKDRTFELSLTGLSDYQRGLRELDRQYADLLKQAGQDKKLRAELLALKEKEIQLLEKEKALTTVANFESFLGLVTPFDQVRKTAEDLIAQIRESPFGDERKARMIGRVMADLARQLDQLAKESALSLFGELASDLEKYGASESLQSEVRRNMAILEHTLKMTHYRTEIEILRASGRLAPVVMAALDKAFEFLEGVDPLSLFGPGANDNKAGANFQRWAESQDAERKRMEDAAKEFEDALKNARNTLDKWNESDKPPIRRELEELASELQKVVAVFGATEEVLSAHAKAYQSILRNHLGPIIEYLTGFDLSADSSLSGAERFAEAQSQFRNLIAEIAGGNLARLGEATQLADLYRSLGRGHTAGEGFRFIEKEIKDALGSVVNLVPGIAGTSFIGAGVLGGGLTGGPSGSSSSPYTIQSPDLQRAIEIGNTMLLAESRNQSQLLNWIGKNTERTANLLTSPLDVRMIS